MAKQGSTPAKKLVDKPSRPSNTQTHENNPSIERKPSTDKDFTKDKNKKSTSVASQGDKQDDGLKDPATRLKYNKLHKLERKNLTSGIFKTQHYVKKNVGRPKKADREKHKK